MLEENKSETHDLDLLDAKVQDAIRKEQRRINGDVNSVRMSAPKDFRNAFSLIAEFIGTVVLFALGGYYIDKYFGTLPLFTIILFLLGLAVGVLNSWRLFKGFGYAAGYKHKSD